MKQHDRTPTLPASMTALIALELVLAPVLQRRLVQLRVVQVEWSMIHSSPSLHSGHSSDSYYSSLHSYCHHLYSPLQAPHQVQIQLRHVRPSLCNQHRYTCPSKRDIANCSAAAGWRGCRTSGHGTYDSDRSHSISFYIVSCVILRLLLYRRVDVVHPSSSYIDDSWHPGAHHVAALHAYSQHHQ